MDMKVIHSEKCLCTSCMEEHEVKTVKILEKMTFKNVPVVYEATYFYCENSEELFMDESQMRINNVAMKDAYRKAQGILTSEEIIAIRNKYGITQKDLCLILGWGAKTITRYESYQIPDRAHDTILKKIADDPKWFLDLLDYEKNVFSDAEYNKYFRVATLLCEQEQNNYLRKTIEARYAKFREDELLRGNTELSLEKVVDVIKYFAASNKVKDLYKVKLMKLMWYADAYFFKTRGVSITGLVYQALQMGAVPVCHDYIISLKGVPCEEVNIGETCAYYFNVKGNVEFDSLSEKEKEVLDLVIDKFGDMTRNEIVSEMHKERAYIETVPRDFINFKFTQDLLI